MAEDDHGSPGAAQSDAETDWQRKRRLARVFGDELPEATRDDEDEPSATEGPGGESAGDRWLKSQVPPHHGG